MSRECLNNPDAFCYICGNFFTVKNRPNITDFIKMYFGVNLGELRWTKGKRSLAFGVPMFWREPKDHTLTECYFCVVKTVRIFSKNKYLNKHLIECPNLPTAIRRVPFY